VIDISDRRREATDLVKFIDAHGGRLGAFRSYQVEPLASPPSEQRPQQREEKQCERRHQYGPRGRTPRTG
jgi:hypothetical protein